MAAGKELHVGLTDEYPPLSYVDANGQRRGFEFDLAADLCRPYYHSRAMCIGRPGGRGPDEAGARIGVYQGSVLVQRARGFWPEAIIVTGSVQELIERLKQGGIDVLFINDLAGYAFLLTDAGLEFDRLDIPFDAETRATGSCVAVRAGRHDLLAAVNRELKTLLYSGELHNRSRNYFQYIIY